MAKDPSVSAGESIPDSEVIRAVEAVLAGHVDAYASIVRRFQDSVMTVAYALLHDRQAADELTQDVFVRAFERLRLFDPSRPMKLWLVKITYRLAQDRWRRQAVVSRQEQAASRQAQGRPGEPDPLESLIADERSRALWHAVAGLPPAEQAAVILYYREGLSVDEVAEAADVTAGSIKTLLFRARARLRTQLAEKGSTASERTMP